MTVVRLPEQRGRWAWDARGDNRAVRVSAHARENVVNLSVWRDDICVGTVRLVPDEVTALVTGLTDGLAVLAARPERSSPSVDHLEQRLARLEAQLGEPAWRTAATRAARSVRDALATRVPRTIRFRSGASTPRRPENGDPDRRAALRGQGVAASGPTDRLGKRARS